MKLLLVDDEPLITDSLTFMLENTFEVTVFNNPEEALSIIENNESFDLVISDFMMPELNGVEFLKRVVVKLPHCKRIILTAYADTDEISDGLKSGLIDDLLQKPFSMMKLQKTIEKLS